MHGNIVRGIITVTLKLAFLALFIVLGIVFVPDDFMSQVGQKVGAAANYLQEESSKRLPGLSEEFSRKVQDTKRDLGSLYLVVKEKYFVDLSQWAAGLAKF